MKSISSQVRAALAKVADRSKAAGMQAYMKSEMPYLGVQATALRKVCREVFAAVELNSAREWEFLVMDLWRNARFREERYVAINLLEDKRALPFQTMKTLALYEKLIVDGAWWDYVDVIAAHRVGQLLTDFPTPMRRKMLAWSKSKNIWKRRTAILSQLSFKEHTDLKLLYACIEPSLDSTEFFLRKAIGWSLRQYAWTDPKEIRRYVKAQSGRLSGLSQREALKNLH
jgi:3-methyladenine DNA glycosylase AlkD